MRTALFWFIMALLALVMSIVLLFAGLQVGESSIDSSTTGAPFPFLEHYNGRHYIDSGTSLFWSCVCIYLFSFTTLILVKIASRSRRLWIVRGLLFGAWLFISGLMIYQQVGTRVPNTALRTRGVPFPWLRIRSYNDRPYHAELTYSIAYPRALASILLWSGVGLVFVRCLTLRGEHRTGLGSPPGKRGMETGVTATVDTPRAVG
jgi:hypothetical protein